MADLLSERQPVAPLSAASPASAPAPAAAAPIARQPTPVPVGRNVIGRVIEVTGAEVTVGLSHTTSITNPARPTVGKFLGILSNNSIIVGMISSIAERPAREQEPTCRSTARLDLVGEIKANKAGGAQFQRGVTEYPLIGEAAMMMTDRELRLVYGSAEAQHLPIGTLQQDASIEANIDIENLISKHFAVLGTTGVGKSNGVAIILQRILDERQDLRIFLIDPHNEYARCFGDKAQVLTPRNLRLPFWLFNFEETIDAFFGGRPGVDEEIEILAEVIPLAKEAYLQYRNNGETRPIYRRKEQSRGAGFGIDTPVPYRIEDLVALIDERMGRLENRGSRTVYSKLLSRIQSFRGHPRYGFMFENANIGGDTMVEVVSHLFRIPANGKPMTIMQLAGFPAEVVNSVVSVLCRMAFDFGLWSDGSAPLLFICEEAHRYAPADTKIGFGPTRRALSRIAKEGRKYGVFLGLVTQRPAEIDPNIISQCSTLFVMRLSNERDQHLIRSAVSDAGASLLTFIPSLGTGEVFAFGAGVALPTRMKFRELPPELRPMSEADGSTRVAAGTVSDRDLIGAVIERWRASTMAGKVYDDDGGGGEWGSPAAPPMPSPPLAPAAYEPQRPIVEPQRPGFEPQRPSIEPQRPSSILRKPLIPDATQLTPPSRWR